MDSKSSESKKGNDVSDVDAVTALQDEITRLCSGFFNFVGALQRDAPAASIAGESLLQSSATSAKTQQEYDLQNQAGSMASELLDGFQQLEVLIKKLPEDIPGQHDAEEMILQQNKENNEVLENLKKEISVAEAKLQKMQQVYENASDIVLKIRPKNTSSGN